MQSVLFCLVFLKGPVLQPVPVGSGHATNPLIARQDRPLAVYHRRMDELAIRIRGTYSLRMRLQDRLGNEPVALRLPPGDAELVVRPATPAELEAGNHRETWFATLTTAHSVERSVVDEMIAAGSGREDATFSPKTLTFTTEVTNQVSAQVRRGIGLLRWRHGVRGAASPFAFVNAEFSTDTKVWHRLRTAGVITIINTATPTVTSETLSDIQSHLEKHVTEPLGHELLREAFSLKRSNNRRSALVAGIAAVEIGVKELIGDLVPESEWLVGNVPSPPIAKMLKSYVPLLPVRRAISGVAVAPPQRLRKLIAEGIEARNRVAHAGAPPLEDEELDDLLEAVADVLWLFDYYRGEDWALGHLTTETRSDLGLGGKGRRISVTLPTGPV